jgi:hypothetical protein
MHVRDDIHPVSITGKILLSDGSETEFSIQPDLGWQQWGNITEKIGATVDLMDALAEASAEFVHEPAEEEECSFCGEMRSPDQFEDGLRCKLCAEKDEEESTYAEDWQGQQDRADDEWNELEH